jgi:hypothetical protein
MNTTVFAPRVLGQRQEMKLVMQSLLLTGRILPVGVRLWIRHGFKSSEAQPVEVIYGFALPRDAALRAAQPSGVLDIEDLLVIISGMLEPDGGMPGSTSEMRMANSLVALLFFHSQKNTEDAGVFRIHVQKLIDFLSAERVQQLNNGHQTAAVRILELLETGESGQRPLGAVRQAARSGRESESERVLVEVRNCRRSGRNITQKRQRFLAPEIAKRNNAKKMLGRRSH